MDSIALTEQARIQRARKTQWLTPNGQIAAGGLQALAVSLPRYLRADEMSYPRGFAESFQIPLNKHLGMVKTYRKNINTILNAQECKCSLAFLLEAHINFSRLIYSDGITARWVLPGELFLWPEIEASLVKASKHVDYLILAQYPSTDDSIKNAVILRCSDLSQSLKRNKMRSVNHYGENAAFRSCRESNLALRFEEHPGGYRLYPEGDKVALVPESVMSECLRYMPRALKDMKEGRPFTSTVSMQTLIELYGDFFLGNPA